MQYPAPQPVPIDRHLLAKMLDDLGVDTVQATELVIRPEHVDITYRNGCRTRVPVVPEQSYPDDGLERGRGFTV